MEDKEFKEVEKFLKKAKKGDIKDLIVKCPSSSSIQSVNKRIVKL